MAQKELTETELKGLINDQVKAVLNAEGMGKVVALIEEKIAAAVSPLRQEATDWQAKIFGAIAPKVEGVKREAGLAFGRIVRAVASAKRSGGGQEAVAKILESWGDGDLAEAQTKALAASVAADGGYLVAPQYATDVLAARRAKTVIRQAGAVEYPMPSGTLHLPKVATGVTGGYIGENANPTHSNPVFGENILTWKKLAVTSAISNDLLRYNSPQSDAVVRDDIVRSLSVTEDAAFIRSQGVGGEPKGLRYWASAGSIIAANTVSIANVTADLGKAIYTMLNNNVPVTKGAWLLSPRSWYYLITIRDAVGNLAFQPEMKGGTLFGYPFFVTTSIPINLTVATNTDCSEVYFVNFDDVVIGDSQRLLIDVSSEAAYYNGSSVVAAFSLDQTVIRAIAEHDLVVRDSNAVVVVTGVRWGV